MEFCTGTTVSRDKTGAELIGSLVSELEREISPEKLAQLSELAAPGDMTSFSEALISHIERTNDIVVRIFRSQLVDSRGQANAYYALAKAIDSMNYRRRPGADRTPAHEAMHCHLVTLGLQHFIFHHKTFTTEILAPYDINPIADQCARLCHALSELREGPVGSNEKLVSVNDFPTLAAVYHKEFNALVKAATGFDTRKTRFVENIPIAQAILASYGCRSYDESNQDAKLLSILDIVAALCSVRHQQESGIEYIPYCHGQKNLGTSPQAMFKKGLRENDPHQHQGVAQIYLYRFAEYQAAFTNTTESYRGWMAYQVARLDAYARIFNLREIGGVVASARHFDGMCLQTAERTASDYASRV
jgi:hypothetical protein